MSRSKNLLAAFIFYSGIASAAALVPIPSPKTTLPAAALEVNRGQAKPEILFLSRGSSPLAITARSILFSPLGIQQNFVASNPNPAVRFLDPLPGTANSFSGPDPAKWVTGILRYATAQLIGIYPGIDAEYAMAPDGQLTLRLQLQPAVDPSAIMFEIPSALNIVNADVNVTIQLGSSRQSPTLSYTSAAAFQKSGFGALSRSVRYVRLSETRFGLRVDDQNSALPLQIEIKIDSPGIFPNAAPHYAVDAAGNSFAALSVSGPAGNDVPFPTQRWAGCGMSIIYPIACLDVAIYKFSKSGDLVFVSYLAGKTNEQTNFLGMDPGGVLVVTGGTDSADFPASRGALQTSYAGPAATFTASTSAPTSGDFFASRIDPQTGALLASTYLGGPQLDSIGETALGSDGSIYFIPKWVVPFSSEMPVSKGALQTDCPGARCLNGYAARIAPALDKLIYGTYLPGTVQATAKLHSDGSVYYAGAATAGFPVSPSAYQRQNAGVEDGIIARLDPTGTKLLFATYLGGPDTDWILRMAVAPDASVWVALSSFEQCCTNIRNRLVHLDSNGERILADQPIDVGDIAVDRDGNLIATAAGNFAAGPNAFLANPCAGSYLAYIKLSPRGELQFASYLPGNIWSDFNGTSYAGLPILQAVDGQFQIIEAQSMGVFTGCVADAASLGNPDVISPGEIITLFGSKLGPPEGLPFHLENGRIPTTLGGTRVLVNGEAIPILFASYWQVNAILPYSLTIRTTPKIQVVSQQGAGNEMASARVDTAGISLFRIGSFSTPNDILPAAALNEDGTVNSPSNRAKRGSRVVLFGTGGGVTDPPGIAGEVTPLRPQPLQNGLTVFAWSAPSLNFTVEYAGAAPGQVAGVVQINVKLPEIIPPITGFPPGILPLSVNSAGGSYYPGVVTVAVDPN